MNNLKSTKSKLALAFDLEENNIASYNSTKDYFEKEIKNIFLNLSKMNKGINFIEAIESEELVLDISNKYYQSRIELTLLEMNQHACVEKDVDALIIFWNSRNLRNFKKITQLINNTSASEETNTNASINNIKSNHYPVNSSKPNCLIIAFHEDRSYLNTFSEFQNFVEFSIDNNFEIITGITDYECVNEDDGIGALNISLQSNTWSSSGKNSLLEQGLLQPNEQVKVIHDDDADDEKTNKTEDIPYEELKEDQCFDDLLDKMNDIRKINTNDRVSDEERRKNAENAIMMFAKFMKLDDDEVDEEDDN